MSKKPIKRQDGIDSYAEARCVMAPSGELLIALPIYANQNGAIFKDNEMANLVGLSINLGCYENMGYLCYTPASDFAFYMNSIDLFEDLGEL